MMKPFNQKTKCITIPNFIDLPADTKFPQKSKQVVSVGRLHTDKGFDRLIDAWSIVQLPFILNWKLKSSVEWSFKR